jgi:hypothetical protein
VAELLSIIMWWTVAVLVGVAAGSLASVVGVGSLTALVGAVALLVGGVMVFASVLANNASALRRSHQGGDSERDVRADLAGAGLLRATLVGFLGAGLSVGALSGNGLSAILAGATAVLAILLTAIGGSSGGRTVK